MAVTNSRRVQLISDSDDTLRVPADVTDLLGDEAQLEIGPGAEVTLRPAKLDSRKLAASVKPLESIDQLKKSTTPLTAEERKALDDFLAG
ncbi:MAG: hypothetical protein J2O48_00900 [Solirubrobacterales bacterium]|nr:hypothetical protein [Solirubrobacterales bacterium]